MVSSSLQVERGQVLRQSSGELKQFIPQLVVHYATLCVQLCRTTHQSSQKRIHTT